MEISPRLSRLERRCGHWGVPHLTKGLVALNCLVFALRLLQPDFARILVFDTAAARAGEYWRVLTFLFTPATGGGNFGLLFFLIAMWFLWFIGDGLENALGAFLLNLYLLIGVVAVAAVGLVFYPATVVDNIFIFTSFLFAFAAFYPDTPILLFFVVEVKIKYIAWFSAAMMAMSCVLLPARAPLVLAGVAGYAVFFGPVLIDDFRRCAGARRRMKKFKGED